MNDSHSHDMLSAFFDDEAAPDERRKVEQLRAGSAEVRQELDEFGRVSDLLRDLPRASLPPEFSAEILRLAERRMLLADAPPALPSPVPPARGRVLPRWWYAVGGIAASAAAVLMTLRWEEERHAPENGGLTPVIAMKSGAPGSGAPEFKAPVSADASPHAEGLHEAEEGTRVLAKHSASSKNEIATRGQAVTEHALAGRTPIENSLNRRDVRTAGGNQTRPDLKDVKWADLPVGQMVEAIDSSGDKIAIVKVIVVERQAGLEAVQVVLEKNAIPRQGGARTEMNNLQVRVAQEGKPEDLTADLFVEATGEQLANAIQNLMHDNQVIELELESPIAVAQLDAHSQQVVAATQEPAAEPAPAKQLGALGDFDGQKRRDVVKAADAADPSRRPAPPSAPAPSAAPIPISPKSIASGTAEQKRDMPDSVAKSLDRKRANEARTPSPPREAAKESQQSLAQNTVSRQVLINGPKVVAKKQEARLEKDAAQDGQSPSTAASRRAEPNKNIAELGIRAADPTVGEMSSQNLARRSHSMRVIFVVEPRPEKSLKSVPPAKKS